MKTFWRFLFLLLLTSTSWAATESEKKLVSELPVATNFSPQSYVLINTGNPPKSVITTVSNVLNVMQTLPNFTNGLGGGGGGGNDKIATNRGTGFFNTLLGSTNRARELSVTNRAALWGGYHVGTSNHTVYVEGSPGSSTLIFSNSAIAAPWLTFSEGSDTVTLRNGTVSGALNANGAFTANNIVEFNDAVQVDGQMSVNNISAFNRAPVFNTNASLSQLPSVPTPSASLLSLYGKAHESTTRLFYKDHLGNEFGPLGIITNGGIVEVRKDGNDALAIRGRSDRAWLTISNAAANLQDGDSMVIYPGTYLELGGQTTAGAHLSNRAAITIYGKKNITIEGIGLPTILNTNVANHLELYECSGVTIRGIRFDGGARKPGSALTNLIIGVDLRNGTRDVRFIDCHWTNMTDHALGVQSSFLPATNIYVDGSCTFNMVGCTSGIPALTLDGSCIQINGDGWYVGPVQMDGFVRGVEFFGDQFKNITLEGIRMRRCWLSGIEMVGSQTTNGYGSNIVIRGCQFLEPQNIGQLINGIQMPFGERVVISDNIIEGPFTHYGIDITDSVTPGQDFRDSEISRNIIRNGMDGMVGIAISDTANSGINSNITIRANRITDMLGLAMSVTLRSSFVADNYIYNVGGGGDNAIDLYNETGASQKNVFRGNVIIGNAASPHGISLKTFGSKATNNTIIDNFFGVYATSPIEDTTGGNNSINFNLTTNILFCGTNHLTACFTNGAGGGAASNAVTIVQTNGATFLTGATAINFSNGANVTVSGSIMGTTGTVLIASTGGGGGTPFPAYIVTTAETGLSNVLNAAVARNIIFSNGTYTVDGDWKVTNTATLTFMQGALLSVNSGKTLNIRGPVDAGKSQYIFTGPGTVSFSNNYVMPDVWAGWFGVSDAWNNQTTNDSSAALQRAILAANVSSSEVDFSASLLGFTAGQMNHFTEHYPWTRRLRLGGGTIVLTNTVTFNPAWHGEIDGNKTTILWNGPSNIVMFSFAEARFVSVHDLIAKAHPDKPCLCFMKFQNLAGGVTPSFNRFSDIWLQGNARGFEIGFWHCGIPFDANQEFFLYNQVSCSDVNNAWIIDHSQSYGHIFINCGFGGYCDRGVTGWHPKWAPTGGGGSICWIGGGGGDTTICDFDLMTFRPAYIGAAQFEQSRKFVATKYINVITNRFSCTTNNTSLAGTNAGVAAYVEDGGLTNGVWHPGYTNIYTANKDTWEYLDATTNIIRVEVNTGVTPYNPSINNGTRFQTVQCGASGITNVIQWSGYSALKTSAQRPLHIEGVQLSTDQCQPDGALISWGAFGPVHITDTIFNVKNKHSIFDIFDAGDPNVDGAAVTIENCKFATLLADPFPGKTRDRVKLNTGGPGWATNAVGVSRAKVSTRANATIYNFSVMTNGVDSESADVIWQHVAGTNWPVQIYGTNELRFGISDRGQIYAAGISFTNGSIIGATGTNTLTITNSHLQFSADNTWDIGASAANRPRDLYVGGRGSFGNDITTSGAFTLHPDSQVNWWSGSYRGRISMPGAGIHLLDNGTGDYSRLDFGGTTAAFPALGKTAGNGHLRVLDAAGSSSTNSLIFGNIVDTTATTGMTMNRQAGRVRLSSGNQTYSLTNNLATANSVVIATVSTDDTTALNVKAIPSAGLITLKCNATTTANTDISFFIAAP